jgi:hypothetical protein
MAKMMDGGIRRGADVLKALALAWVFLALALPRHKRPPAAGPKPVIKPAPVAG